jgi:hypothetical protein
MSDVTEMVSGCLFRVLLVDALGSSNLITFGLTRVDVIRKNNIKKNMMSFSEAVATSG